MRNCVGLMGRRPSSRLNNTTTNNNNNNKNNNSNTSNSTVGFHNFNLRIFNLRVSNPNKLIVDVFLTRCGISMCQSLGPKKHDEISEIGCNNHNHNDKIN